jgi:2,4-dienoyl-CoA reductase (NADPH2)
VVGGQLVFGSVTPYKKELYNLIRFQKRQIERFGVTCHLNTEVTKERIEAEAPDVVILATGSVPAYPPVEGMEATKVASVMDVMGTDQDVGQKTVVIGGGPTGCEVAYHLSGDGSPVTILEMLPKIGTGLESMTKKLLLRKLKENHVQVKTECRLKRVEANGVLIENKDGQEEFIEAEKIVTAIGTRPDNRLYEQIKDMGIEIYRIGDCLEPRSAKAAIYEGGVLGRTI